MEPQVPQRNPLSIPVAIIIAGALIAGALYFSNLNKGQVVSNVQNTPENIPTEIVIKDMTVRGVSTSDHVLGNPSSPVTIVEYSDTECPFCKQFHVNMHKIVGNYGKDGKLAWVYRHFPLDSLHKKARNEARATECAAKVGGEEKFWAYIDRLFQVTTSNDGLDESELPKIAKYVGLNEKTFSDCLLKTDEGSVKIQTDYDEAIKAGGNGTPFNILISKKKFDPEKMKKSVNAIAEKYNLPLDLFVVSKDGTKLAVSGAMPYEIMEQFIKLFQAL